MEKRIIPIVLAFVLWLSGSAASAGVCHYTDSSGEVHFVDDISKVPEQYRSRVKNAEQLPEVNVVGRPGPVKYEPLSVPDSRSIDQPSKKAKQYSGTVEIFMTSWCGYCKQLEKFLDANGISYTAYDIEKDSSANKTYKELGGRGVPLSRIGSTVVRGYNPDAILKAVEQDR